MTIQERAQEIEKSIIDDTINFNSLTGLMAFSEFLSDDNNWSDDEFITIKEIVKHALQAPFSDRHKPINALVCRAIEWQAERLARLEQ